MAHNFVCLASYDTAHEAHVTRGLLESAGIPAFLRNEHLVSVNSFYGVAAGGVDVMVPEECAADALRFLQGHPDVEPQPGDAAQDEAPAPCPHCGGPVVQRRRLWPALLALLFCASPATGTPCVRVCTVCGKKMR